MRRIISRNPVTGVETWFHYDNETGDSIITSEQEVDGTLELNKAQFNDAPQRWGNDVFHKVASIPLVVLDDLKQRGIADDPAAMKRWLNDPDNRFFRTRPGNV